MTFSPLTDFLEYFRALADGSSVENQGFQSTFCDVPAQVFRIEVVAIPHQRLCGSQPLPRGTPKVGDFLAGHPFSSFLLVFLVKSSSFVAY